MMLSARNHDEQQAQNGQVATIQPPDPTQPKANPKKKRTQKVYVIVDPQAEDPTKPVKRVTRDLKTAFEAMVEGDKVQEVDIT